jgi:hypothetical protein
LPRPCVNSSRFDIKAAQPAWDRPGAAAPLRRRRAGTGAARSNGPRPGWGGADSRQRRCLNPNCAAVAAQRGEWKRGCQPAIQTKVGVYAACTTLGASDRRRTSVRRRVANRLAWTGLIR